MCSSDLNVLGEAINPTQSFATTEANRTVAAGSAVRPDGRKNIMVEYYVALTTQEEIDKAMAIKADPALGGEEAVEIVTKKTPAQTDGNGNETAPATETIVGAWLAEDQDREALRNYMGGFTATTGEFAGRTFAGQTHYVDGTVNRFSGLTDTTGTTYDRRGVYNINLFREAQAMRWTYFDVPATASVKNADGTFTADGLAPFALNDVELEGVARFNDTRSPLNLWTDIANYYEGTVAVDVAYSHLHNETTTLDFQNPLYTDDVIQGATFGDAASTNVEHGEWRTHQNQWDAIDEPIRVYRKSPNVQFQNQVFQTQEEATAAYDENADQKSGYVAGETFWYRDTLVNAKLAAVATKPVMSMGGWAFNGTEYYSNSNYHVNSSTSSMSFSFTAYSDTKVSWQYRVSSESASYDYLYWRVYRNGALVSSMNGGNYGGNTGWQTWPSYNVSAGNYEVYFYYRKDGSVHSGDDRAYIRNINVADAIDQSVGEGSAEEKTKLQVLKTHEEGAGEGEIYNPVFYERIPLDYLRQASQYAYDDAASVSGNLGARITEEYLESVLNAKADDGSALGIAWYDRFGNDVTAERTRGLKLKATLVGTETEAADYGGSMNYASQELGLCTNGGLNNPCLDGGSNKYTWGKTYNDLDPRDKNVSNPTTFGLFKIEWEIGRAHV